MTTWYALYEHPELGRGNVRIGNVVLQEPSPQEVYDSLESLSREVSPRCQLGRILAEATITIYDYAGKGGVRYVLEPIRPGIVDKVVSAFRQFFAGTSTPQPVWRSVPEWGSRSS